MSRNDVRSTYRDVPVLAAVMNESVERLLERRSALSHEEVALFRRILPNLMATYGDVVWGVAWSRWRAEHEAENCFQGAFQEFYRSVVAKGFPEDIAGFLVTITSRDAIDMARAQGRAPMTEVYPSSGSAKPASGGSVESLVARAQLARALMAELSPEHRAVAQMKFVEGRTDEEIAGQMNVVLGTAKSRVAAARAALVAAHERLAPPSRPRAK